MRLRLRLGHLSRSPGGFEGTLRVDARWGSPNADGDCNASEGCEDEDGKITLGGAVS